MEISFEQVDTEQSENKLKNYALSKTMLGLICSSKEYHADYYGIPGKARTEFAFIAMMIVPESKNDLKMETLFQE